MCNYLYEKLHIDLGLVTHNSNFETEFSQCIRFPVLPVLIGQSPSPWIRLTSAPFNIRIIKKTLESFGISIKRVFVNASIDTLFEAYLTNHRKVIAGYNVLYKPNSFILHVMDHLAVKYAIRRIVAHTQFQKKFYMQLGVEEGKIVVVPHCIDLKRVEKSVKECSKKVRNSKYEEKNDLKPIIFYGGRLIIEKGIRELLSCYESICEIHPVTLMLMGEGPLKEWILQRKKAIERHHRNAEIVLLPWQPPTVFLRHMANASIVVLPTYVEFFGIVVLEAMSFRKPVVATRFGGTSEIITDHRDGILVNPHNKQELEENILELLGDTKMRRRIGRNAFKTMQSRYEVSKVAPQFLRFMEEDR